MFFTGIKAANIIKLKFQGYNRDKKHKININQKNIIIQNKRQQFEMIEKITTQGTLTYQMKSFFAPKSFPPPPISIHGKLTSTTREEIYRAENELKKSEIKLKTTIATNNMLRAETMKYHMMRREW